jgi:hypothetical protein
MAVVAEERFDLCKTPPEWFIEWDEWKEIGTERLLEPSTP